MSNIASAFPIICSTSSTSAIIININNQISHVLSLKIDLRASKLLKMDENLLIKLRHGCVFPPLLKVIGKLYCMPPDFLTNFTRLLALSCNECKSSLCSQETSHPVLIEVDKQWHAQLIWYFECVAATVFAS